MRETKVCCSTENDCLVGTKEYHPRLRVFSH